MKKHKSLDYSSQFVGQDFVSKNEDLHLRVIAVSDMRYKKNTFSVDFYVYAVRKNIPLKNERNGLISVDILLRDFYPNTKTGRLLYEK